MATSSSFGQRMAAIRAAKASASGVKVPAFVKTVASKSQPKNRKSSSPAGPMLSSKVINDIKNSPKGVVPKSVQKFAGSQKTGNNMPTVPKADRPTK